jgi:putative ABC transport system substrate-binding protein
LSGLVSPVRLSGRRTLSDASYREVGVYIGKILNGARPADLPVIGPKTYELIINFKTAKELDITIPPSIMVRADELIE